MECEICLEERRLYVLDCCEKLICHLCMCKIFFLGNYNFKCPFCREETYSSKYLYFVRTERFCEGCQKVLELEEKCNCDRKTYFRDEKYFVEIVEQREEFGLLYVKISNGMMLSFGNGPKEKLKEYLLTPEGEILYIEDDIAYRWEYSIPRWFLNLSQLEF